MSFVSDIISVAGDAAGALVGGALNFLSTNPAGMAISGIATAGMSGALGTGFATSGLTQGASGLISGSNALTSLGGLSMGNYAAALSSVGSVAGVGIDVTKAASVGVDLAGNIAGAGVQIAPAAFDQALAASTGVWGSVGSVLSKASNVVKTASNVYKAVNAVNTLTGQSKKVPVNTAASSLGAGWAIPVNQTPVTIDTSTTSPIGASTNGGLATSSYMPADPVNATAQSNNSMLLMMVLGGAALWFLKVKS